MVLSLCTGRGTPADVVRDDPRFAQTLGVEMEDALDKAVQSGRPVGDALFQQFGEALYAF